MKNIFKHTRNKQILHTNNAKIYIISHILREDDDQTFSRYYFVLKVLF